jgi:hypothetical protein
MTEKNYAGSLGFRRWADDYHLLWRGKYSIDESGSAANSQSGPIG